MIVYLAVPMWDTYTIYSHILRLKELYLYSMVLGDGVCRQQCMDKYASEAVKQAIENENSKVFYSALSAALKREFNDTITRASMTRFYSPLK